MAHPGQREGTISASTLTFQMPLGHPVWSYADEASGRLVDVEVDVRALLSLSYAGSAKYATTPTLVGKRHVVEQVARGIIDREGPSFVQPVRVTVRDV
ncbi:hypothetical protein [Sphingomonas sp. TDK1]|uniref:hypothetical protein n=1 Tax=Sphingomonas sp. TDK1 TaxID=453247 RepID=UPI000A44E9F0|nr:hypothetical protein [Sphingomonas sp. TDK1]